MPRVAATSPRRSVRARQQPSIAPSQTNSVSSNSSNRAERNTRHSNKPASPQKSSTPQSLSSEEVGGPARASNSEPPQPRRSKRQHDIDEEDVTKTEEAVEDEIIEDEETTRCMCGQLEYPGPPVDAPAGSARGGKNASPPDELSDEISGLFIQCDDCLVWQHGGCVSIMEQSAVPDNYYCEECKPELHLIFKSTSG
jgi:DNA mismatch repair ATPase MutL